MLLAVAAVWLGRAALYTRMPLLMLEALLAIAALAAAASGRRFARYPVLLLALLMSGEWLSSVWLSVRIGYFARLPVGAIVAALWPGVALEVAAIYACIAALVYLPGEPPAPR